MNRTPGWSDDDLVAISAIEHWSYCPRQCALIHLEQTFEESVHTMRGRRVHERADSGLASVARGVRTARSVPLWSDRLGLIGRADIVEFRPTGPCPIEYKSGRKRIGEHEALQVCAQAMCLEEMLGVPVPQGEIWWHASKSRQTIACDANLRTRVESAIIEVRTMLASRRLPPAIEDRRCKECSLRDACLPGLCSRPRQVLRWIADLYSPEEAP